MTGPQLRGLTSSQSLLCSSICLQPLYSASITSVDVTSFSLKNCLTKPCSTTAHQATAPMPGTYHGWAAGRVSGASGSAESTDGELVMIITIARLHGLALRPQAHADACRSLRTVHSLGKHALTASKDGCCAP